MPRKKETLIILSPGFPSDEAESTCLPAHQVFIKALNKNFPALNIIILSFHYPYVAKTYQWYNNTVAAFNGRGKRKLHRIILWLRVWRKLHELKKHNHIVGLFSFWCNECAFTGTYFVKLFKLKHFCWITGQDAKKENYLVKLIRPKSGELVAMSDFLAQEFYKNHHIKPLHIIPNGIDVTLFDPEKFSRSIDVLAAGSLIRLKQYDIFIEVVKALTKHIPGLYSILCGAGPERESLQQQVETNNLSNHLFLSGEKPHSQVLHLMQQAKIFLHTSSYEGFSTVCLEALYAGAQVISFCKPMYNNIDNWHIVTTKEEMIYKALQLLQNAGTAYTPVLAYSMDESAKAVMNLFRS